MKQCMNCSYSTKVSIRFAIMTELNSNLLINRIVINLSDNSPINRDFDNFDQFASLGSASTAHEIILQGAGD